MSAEIGCRVDSRIPLPRSRYDIDDLKQVILANSIKL